MVIPLIQLAFAHIAKLNLKELHQMNLKKITGKKLAQGYIGYRALDAVMNPVVEVIRLAVWLVIIICTALALSVLERL
jgi:hypothetical protein